MSVVVEGRGLHGGALARVTIGAHDGPITIAAGGVRGALDAWRAVHAERSSAIAFGGIVVRTVEHLFSALGGVGVHHGIAIDVDGPELQILDGASAAWLRAIDASGAVARSSASRLRVARPGEIRVGRSVYTFACAAAPRIVVRVELGDPRLATDVAWDGDAADYRARIAPARTFCFASELDELAARGLAAHVPPESVIVIGAELMSTGVPAASDEPAHHKLLDLIGDLYLYGGPPRGAIDAFRPGHAATHDAMNQALQRGLVVADAWVPPSTVY